MTDWFDQQMDRIRRRNDDLMSALLGNAVTDPRRSNDDDLRKQATVSQFPEQVEEARELELVIAVRKLCDDHGYDEVEEALSDISDEYPMCGGCGSRNGGCR